MSYALVKGLHPATAVTACAAGRLLARESAEGLDLAVARGNRLELYRPRVGGGEARRQSRLDLVAEFQLPDGVASLAVLPRRTHHQRDALLVAFREAKLVAVEFHTSKEGLKITSMHSFEDDVTPGMEGFPVPTKVVADPLGRCAAMTVGDADLAFLRTVEFDSTYGLALDEDDEEGTAVKGFKAAAIEKGGYTVPLRKLGLGAVRDLTFLHGYNEPVLVVLHEAVPTWSGRLRERKDTCVLTAFSLNLYYKRHPVIWSIRDLPYDAQKLVAVPPPEGGVLLFCRNLLFYCAQGAYVAAATNKYAFAGPAKEPKTKLPDPVKGDPNHVLTVMNARNASNTVIPEVVPQLAAKAQLAPGLSVDLDRAHAAFVDSHLALVALATGQLLQLQLISDKQRVRKLEIAPSGACSIPSCMFPLGQQLMFLGSALGDSVLLRLRPASKATKAAEGELEESDERAFKRPKTEAAGEGAAEDDGADEIERALFADGGDGGDGATADRYSLAVADRFINCGPCVSVCTGEAAGGATQLVGCSGFKKHGALVVSQQNVNPNRLIEVPLPDITYMDTVFNPAARGVKSKDRDAVPYHDYLLLSTPTKTMVLETNEELAEVSGQVEFLTDSATLLCKNMFGNKLVAQVCPRSVRLVQNGKLKQELKGADIGAEGTVAVADAAVADTMVLLRLSDGTARLLVRDGVKDALKVAATKPPMGGEEEGGERTVKSASWVTALSLFEDARRWMAQSADVHSTADTFATMVNGAGTLQICSLPDWEPVFQCSNYTDMLQIYRNEADDDAEQPAPRESKFHVASVRLEIFAEDCIAQPVLFSLMSNGEMQLHKVLLDKKRNLRILKIEVDFAPVRVQPAPPPGPGAKAPAANPACINRFEHVGKYSGFFVTGAKPFWVVLYHGHVRVHPMLLDAATAFTSFHNVNCKRGFIYSTAGKVNVSLLPESLHLDTPWPTRKVPMGGTPRGVAWLPEQKLYAVLVSKRIPYRERKPEEPGGDAHATNAYAADEAAAAADGFEEGHELRLVVPGTWETAWSMLLDPSERGLCISHVSIRNMTDGSFTSMVAVGTATPRGEDYPCRGRVILVQASRAQDPGGAKWAGKLVSEKDFRGTPGGGNVMSVSSMDGYLLCGVGMKALMFMWHGEAPAATPQGRPPTPQLEQCGFFDAPLSVNCMATIKSFILCGDIQKSIHFLQWRDKGPNQRVLSRLSHDYHAAAACAVDFLVEGKCLTLLSIDDRQNVRLYVFDMANPASYRGKRLLHHAAFHLPCAVTKLLRQRIRTAAPGANGKPATVFGSLFASREGALGIVSPVDESAYRRLHALEREMLLRIPHPCGLNPLACHHPYKMDGYIAHPPTANKILDGDLLWRYLQLAKSEQAQIASAISTRPDTVIKNLEALAGSTLLF